MATAQQIVTLEGALTETFPQLELDTIQHAAEVTKDRMINPKLRKRAFWAADGNIYRNQGGEAYFSLTPRHLNPILNHFLEAAAQLLTGSYNYSVPKEDLDKIVQAVGNGVLDVKQSDLNLQKLNDENSFFSFDIIQYKSQLNQNQMAVAEHIYGKGDNFNLAMRIFPYLKRPKNVRIKVLNPQYVLKHCKDGEAIARFSLLSSTVGYTFTDGFGFNTVHPNISDGRLALRGAFIPTLTGAGKIDYSALAAQVNSPSPEFDPKLLASELTQSGFNSLLAIIQAYGNQDKKQ